MIFFVFALISIALLIPFTYVSFNAVVNWSNNAPEGYHYPKVFDFKVLLVSCPGYIFIEKSLSDLLSQVVLSVLKD